MAKCSTVLREQCVPFFYPTNGGSAVKTDGQLLFTLPGLLGIGPHSFNHLQPIDFEYDGYRLFRAPGSSTVEVTTPSGETYRFRYLSSSSTWMEVRIFECPASPWPYVERLFRDAIVEHGLLFGTIGIVFASATWLYVWILFCLVPWALWRAAPSLIVLFISLTGSIAIYESEWGDHSSSATTDAIVAAYFFPLGFVSLVIFHVLVAAWKQKSVKCRQMWRSAGVRVLLVTVATVVALVLYVQDAPLSLETFSSAWRRVLIGVEANGIGR